ncbi:hypothetical protein F9Y90_04915 (plasmid) [Borrelia miyamotoi]|uniref:Uncharacterized protein n=1 Tax=Borrelia miyamotoi TaxID=47466 RepID=A0A5P8ARF8_9SPIR|nr:hypothetical protein [Borrelia miyamotoi]QFP42448.1 hypothetical protein F9Y90_04915 [Borrelia miyamotoi]WAZ72297.1 hypothetical protein O5404_04560 [Borrelia miyamotoi]WVI05291.1 hypothetical protein F9Y91_00215 [Borrelia miyamotoi]
MNNNITKTNMQDVINNQGLIMNENQSKIDFLKLLQTLQIQLSGVGKNLTGFGYKYQDFNEIIKGN